MLQIIGLSGYARSGKDEAAKVLVEEFGFRRIAFADKLKEFIYAANPIVSANFFDDELIYLQDIIDKYGWDGYKNTSESFEIRKIIQRIGTDAGRGILGDNVWVNAAFAGIEYDDRIVFSDCRFKNEADEIVSFGGKVVRITKTGGIPVNAHISETALDDYSFDYHINNDGSLEDYKNKVRALAVDL